MIAADGSGRRRPGSWRRESVTRRGFMMIGGRGERVNLKFYFIDFDFDFEKYFAECSSFTFNHIFRLPPFNKQRREEQQ